MQTTEFYFNQGNLRLECKRCFINIITKRRKKIPLRPKSEREESIKEYQKRYRDENREKIAEKRLSHKQNSLTKGTKP